MKYYYLCYIEFASGSLPGSGSLNGEKYASVLCIFISLFYSISDIVFNPFEHDYSKNILYIYIYVLIYGCVFWVMFGGETERAREKARERREESKRNTDMCILRICLCLHYLSYAFKCSQTYIKMTVDMQRNFSWEQVN